MKNRICVISLLTILLTGCTSDPSQNTLPESKLVICQLDFTGSFVYLGESVDKLADTVDELNPGDEFMASAIDGSNSGRHILHAKLPLRTRAIDSRNQRRVHTMKLKLKQLLMGINTSQVSRKTDLLGPIYAASQIFARAPDKQKFLLLFTDLEDNAGQTIPKDALDMQDVRVIAFFISPESIQKDIQIRRKWAELFEGAGASFEMLNVSESRSRSPILGPGGAK
jgi:hypothetical protein